MGYVYRILNTINNKNYIGITVNYEERWQQHKRALRKNKHVNLKLQHAWNKYGEQSFIFEILEECADAQMYQKEIEYVCKFNSFDNGYNLTRGGDKGGSESWEKQVYVYDLLGNYIDSFCSRREAERQLDCHSIKECCLGSCSRGFSKTRKEWYQFSYTKMDRYPPYVFHGKMTEVYKLDDFGNIVQHYPSFTLAYSEYGRKSGHNIQDACLTHKKYRGYYWCKVQDYTPAWTPYQDEVVIDIYDLDNHYIRSFSSKKEVSSYLKVDYSAVCKMLKRKQSTVGGYILTYHKE